MRRAGVVLLEKQVANSRQNVHFLERANSIFRHTLPAKTNNYDNFDHFAFLLAISYSETSYRSAAAHTLAWGKL
jgi:hypothetical protein